MKLSIITVLFSVASCFSASADDPLRLETLRDSYNREIETITATTKEKYLKALRDLQSAYTKSADALSARAVTTEIERIQGSVITKDVDSPEDERQPMPRRRTLERDLPESVWVAEDPDFWISRIEFTSDSIVNLFKKGAGQQKRPAEITNEGVVNIIWDSGPAPLTFNEDLSELVYGKGKFKRLKPN